MTKLVTISGRKLCKILEKLGFEKVYGKGSHIRFRHSDALENQRFSVPRNFSISLEEELLFLSIQMRR